MKKNYILLAFSSLLGIVNTIAQDGIHFQQFSNYVYVYNKDSVYMTANVSDDYSRMVLVNPSTKAWKYLNTVDYGKYLGPFVMKNPQEGVMIYSSSSKVYKTTDGWQTLNEISGAPSDLREIIKSDAGYIAYQNYLKDFYFSADGSTWTLALDASSGTNAMASVGNKVFIYSGMSSNYVSTDGGQTFSNLPSNITLSGTFKSFAMLTEDTLMIATNYNLYKSFDGGQTWTAGLPFPVQIQSIGIKDSLTMFISTPSQTYYYTSDGGLNWQLKSVPTTAGGTIGFIENDIYLWPSLKSSDNGNTWSDFFPQTIANGTFFDIYFKGDIGIFGRGGGKVALSFNKGRSLSSDITSLGSEDIMAVKILNNGDFIAGDRKSQIFYSSDSGQTWNQRFSNSFTYNAVKFSHSANDSIIVETRLGQPVVSSDHGSTFNYITVGGGNHSQTVKPNGEIIDAGEWFDYSSFQNKGITISKFTPSGVKTILDTILISSNAATESVVDVVMANNNVGYVLTSNSATSSNNIYKTTNGFANGGTSFVATVPSFNANRLYVIGTDTLFLTPVSTPTSKNYYYSYNGGVTWAQATLDIFTTYPSLYKSLKKGFFLDASNYIFALNDHGLYVNTSGGNGTPPTPNGISELTNSTWGNSKEIKVYPNPANNQIQLDYTGNADITIVDYTGRTVYKNVKAEASEPISVSGLSTGLYIITVQNQSGKFVARFVKQ